MWAGLRVPLPRWLAGSLVVFGEIQKVLGSWMVRNPLRDALCRLVSGLQVGLAEILAVLGA